MKTLSEYINECLIFESFKSQIVRELIEKCKEQSYTMQIEIYYRHKWIPFAYSDNNGKLRILYKPFFLGEIEDNDIWKGKLFTLNDIKTQFNIKHDDDIIKSITDIANKNDLMFIALTHDKYDNVPIKSGYYSDTMVMYMGKKLYYAIFLESSVHKNIQKVLDKIKFREIKREDLKKKEDKQA